MRGTHVRTPSPKTPANLWRKLGKVVWNNGTYSRDPQYMQNCNRNLMKKGYGKRRDAGAIKPYGRAGRAGAFGIGSYAAWRVEVMQARAARG